MPMTPTQQTDAYRFFAIAFSAAPGVEYMNQIAAAYEGNATTKQIVNEFTKKSVFTNVYPNFLTNEQFAARLIDNVVGSSATDAAKTEAKADVVAALAKGSSRGDVIFQIFSNLAGLTGDAKWGNMAQKMANQVATSQYYTETLLKTSTDIATLQAVLAGVDHTTSVTTAALDARLNPPPAGQTFTLTTGTDTVTGTAGNDTINAPLAGAAGTSLTFSALDNIDGGAGRDTLYVETNAVTNNLSLVKNVESVQINNSAVNATVALPSDNKVVALTNVGSTENVTFNNVANASTTLTLSGTTAAKTTTLGYTTTALSGSADSLGLTLNATTGQTVAFSGSNTTTNNLETIAITSTADSAVTLNLANTSPSKITIAGAGGTTLTAVNGASSDLKTIDASAAAGNVSIPAITGVSSPTISGGAGNDNISASSGNNVITGGAGADTITAGSGNDNIDAGDGNDWVVLGSGLTKDDTISGGNGTDTLVVSSNLSYSTSSTDVQPGTRLSGFEVVRATADVTTFDMTGITGVTSLVSDGGSLIVTKDTTITGVTFLTDGKSIATASAGTQAVTIGQASGTAGIQGTLRTAATTLNVVAANKVAIADTTQNKLTIDASSSGVVNATVATVNLSGDDRIELSTTGTALTRVDASGVTAQAPNTTSYAVTVSATSSAGAVTFVPGAGAVSVSTGNGADTVTGTSYNDYFSTGAGSDSVTAGDGNDTVIAGNGSDTVSLGSGNDSAEGGDGADNITGGAGNDTLNGGNDADTLDGGEGNDSINGGDGADSIVGGDGNDILVDGDGNDVVLGGNGVDTITIGNGTDSVDAGAGNDSITITGLSSADTIIGGDGTDTLTITNSSSSTIAPTFTGIEAISVKTSSALAMDLTNAAGAASLTSFTISGSSTSNTNNVTITNAVSGSTFTISDDNTWDGDATTANPADDGNINNVTLDTTPGGTITLNVGANEDLLTHTGTTFAATAITDAGIVTINSKNADLYSVTNNLGSLSLSNTETNTLTITAERYAGLTVGGVTNTGNLQSLTVTSNADTTSNLGSVADITALSNLSLTSTGANSQLTAGAMGATPGAALKSVTLQAIEGGKLIADTITASSNTSSVTSGTVSMKASGAGAQLNVAAVNLGAATLTTLGIEVGSNAIMEMTAGSITSGTITTANVTLSDFSTLRDNGSNGSESLTITGGVTTANVSLGRNVTNDGGDNINFGGAVGTLALSSTLSNEAIAMNSSNTLSYGGNALMDFSTITTAASYTHTGTGNLTWDGSAITGNQTITAVATSTATANLTGGSGNDSLTGNAAANTLTGGLGNDTLTGLAGADSLVGGGGVDSLVAGEGADTLNGGAGNDRINLSESQSAADVVQIGSTGSGATSESPATLSTTALDTGGDTITAFDLDTDTVVITASGVVNFVPSTHVSVGTGTSSTAAATLEANTGTAAEFSALTVLVDVTGATSSTTIAIGSGDIAFTLSSPTKSGVAWGTTTNPLTTAQIAARLQYNLTGDGNANVITGGDLADTITGGAGGDVMTGGSGADTFVGVGTAGQSVVASANGLAVGATNGWDASETITFATTSAGNVDRITDFVPGTDKLDVAGAGGVAPTSLIGVAGALTNGTTYVVYGTYVAGTGVFTAAAAWNATTAPDALVVTGDGTLTALNSTGYVVLTGLAAALTGPDFI